MCMLNTEQIRNLNFYNENFFFVQACMIFIAFFLSIVVEMNNIFCVCFICGTVFWTSYWLLLSHYRMLAKQAKQCAGKYNLPFNYTTIKIIYRLNMNDGYLINENRETRGLHTKNHFNYIGPNENVTKGLISN